MTRTGIKLDLDVGDLLANAGRARGALSSIGDAMKKAESEGRYDDYGKLAFEKERMQGRTAGFEKDIRQLYNNPKFQGVGANGQQVLKVDQEYASLIKAQTNEMKKLTAMYEQAIQKGDVDAVRGIGSQIEKQQSDFHKMVEQAGSPVGGRGIKEAVQAIGTERLVNALNEGFSRWAGSLDRSGIVRQYGSGDIMGARVSEMQRQDDLRGGIAQTGLGILGTVAGAFFGPGGALLGGTIGAGLGQALNTGLHIGVNKESTNAAYAELWQSRAGDAMELAALKGSPNRVREAFNIAANAAAEFGYSAEEGMEAMKQAARQGLDGSGVRQILQYERSTGADRGTLTSIANMSARYGGGDALRVGYAGLQASGMKAGQYDEYLRAMQRVMEDGISKGFVRSSDQVARNLTMLANMTNNSPLWQGENGGRRLQEINSGIEGATGLQSSGDIMVFRAAREIYGENISWADAMGHIEKGISQDKGTEFFNKIMEIFYKNNQGNREDFISFIKQQFGMSYNNAIALADAWIPNQNLSTVEMNRRMQGSSALVTANSAELEWAKITQGITNWWTEKGMTYWDRQLESLRGEFAGLRNGLADLKEGKNNTGGGGNYNAGSSRNSEYGGIVYGDNSHYKTALLDKLFDSDENRNKNRVDEIISMSLALGNPDAAGREKGRQVSTWLHELPDITAGQMNRENTLNNVKDITQIYTLLERLINEIREVRNSVDNSSLEVSY